MLLCKRKKRSHPLTQQTGARAPQYRHFGFKSHFQGSTIFFSLVKEQPYFRGSTYQSEKSYSSLFNRSIFFLLLVKMVYYVLKVLHIILLKERALFLPLKKEFGCPSIKKDQRFFSLHEIYIQIPESLWCLKIPFCGVFTSKVADSFLICWFTVNLAVTSLANFVLEICVFCQKMPYLVLTTHIPLMLKSPLVTLGKISKYTSRTASPWWWKILCALDLSSKNCLHRALGILECAGFFVDNWTSLVQLYSKQCHGNRQERGVVGA